MVGSLPFFCYLVGCAKNKKIFVSVTLRTLLCHGSGIHDILLCNISHVVTSTG